MHSFSISTTCSYITTYKGAQDPENVNFLLDTINPNVDANLLKTNNKKISKMHKRLINTWSIITLKRQGRELFSSHYVVGAMPTLKIKHKFLGHANYKSLELYKINEAFIFSFLKKKKKKIKNTLRIICAEKLFIKFLDSIFFNNSCLIYNIVNPFLLVT